tara:strand:+ start:39 stop:410 length:372 start_codon:yes stop_codon:yes gene_type:complete
MSKKLYFFFLVVCVIQLFYIFHFRSGFKFEVFKNPFNKTSGIMHAVPSEVVELNKILKKNNFNDFNLSENFTSNTFLYQRAIEFNYPVRINKNSDNIFYLIEEKILNNCVLVETGNYLKLAKC